VLRVDLERRQIAASVRDLAFPAGGMPQAAGRMGTLRAEMGADVHRRYARSRARSEPGFRSEVYAEWTTTVDGFSLRLTGRIDGVIETDEGVVVEEVKSLDTRGEDLAAMTEDDVSAAALQVRLYALMLVRTDRAPHARARVVLVSLLDGTERTLDVPLDAGATEHELECLVRRQIAAAHDRAERARERAAVAARLRFPYDAQRRHQDELVRAIETGLQADRPVLAEAPTGIGKTVAALVPALRHALSRDALLLYLTAKRTQRRRVADTFEDIARASGMARGELRALTLRPRQEMCPPGTFDCHVERCPLLARLHEATPRERAVQRLLDRGGHITPDDVLAEAERERLCPHLLSRVLCAHVDVVIGDYNHLYGSVTEPGVFPGAQLPRPVLAVVDEAHNLLDRAREYDSVFLSRRRVSALRDEGMALRRVADSVLELIDEIVVHAAREGTRSRDGRCTAEIAGAPWEAVARRATGALVEYLQRPAQRFGPPHEDPVVETLDTIVRLRDLVKRDEPQLVAYAACDPQSDVGVGVCCVDPSARLERRHKQMAGTVAMSATLSPLPHYSNGLGFAELDPVQASLPSPFPEEQRCVVVVPSVDTTWRRRRFAYARIAREIEAATDVRPGHHVAFFPSYRFLADVRAHLRVPPHRLLVQEHRMPDRERAAVIARLRDDPEPVLLLAVAGGVFAEGIDLPGDALVGAIVVGPSLPSIGFERDAMRRYHDDHGRDGFVHAMLVPGMQRVIQAAGRVHRTAEDRGTIVLLGRRFAEPQVTACLPGHWRDGTSPPVRSGDARAVLDRFWRRAATPSG
jgi:DNA excision repair protein ERCC-2